MICVKKYYYQQGLVHACAGSRQVHGQVHLQVQGHVLIMAIPQI